MNDMAWNVAGLDTFEKTSSSGLLEEWQAHVVQTSGMMAIADEVDPVSKHDKHFWPPLPSPHIAAFGGELSPLSGKVILSTGGSRRLREPVIAKRQALKLREAFRRFALSARIERANYRQVSDFQKGDLFRLGGVFAPSTDMVMYWVNGLRYYAKLGSEAHAAPLNSLGVTDLSKLKKEFSILLFDLLVDQARTQRQSKPIVIPILDGEEGFYPQFENRIAESFAVRPKDMGLFLSLLVLEISEYFKGGGKEEGSWGIITFENDVLCFKLTAKKAAIGPVRRSVGVKVDV